MYIEDIISVLFYVTTAESYDRQLIEGFIKHIDQGLGLTEKQARFSLKIIKKYSAALTQLNIDVGAVISNPRYRNPFRFINENKKISIEYTELSKNSSQKRIKVEFPYNDNIISYIQKNRGKIDTSGWDSKKKSWGFSLCEKNIKFLMELASKENFDVDEEFQKYANQTRDILSTMEEYIPMLVIEDQSLKIKNVSKYVPQLTSTDMLSAVFEARTYGITTWDDEISSFIDSDNIRNITKEFLKIDPSEHYHVNSLNVPISDLEDFVKHLSPCLFIIPGGDELKKLDTAVNFLNSVGITNEQMSVMFRLPTETHKNFNDFVKDRRLNSPISKNTKIVFISAKLPKLILKLKMKFNLIINMGQFTVHNILHMYLHNHENLIYFSEEKKQKDLIFDYL